MGKQAPVQYTIRGVPREVGRILRQRAKQRGESLNQLLVHELTVATVGRPKRADSAISWENGPPIPFLTRLWLSAAN